MRDSLIWIDAKRDSIYMLARRYGVNRADVEGLIDFDDVSATKKALMELADCGGSDNLDVFSRDLDAVLNTPTDLSNVYLLFKGTDMASTYETNKKISLLDDYTYHFTKKGQYYVQFYSPWNKSRCSTIVPLIIDDFNPEVILLYENFRSAKSIVRYANKLEQTDSETNYFYEGELIFNSFADEESETNYIVEKIKYLLKNGHPDIDHDLDYVDFAIIARNRFSLDKIAEELSKNNIDFYFKKSQAGIILDSELMNVFDLCLRLIINDKDIIHRQQLQKIIGDSNVEKIKQKLKRGLK